MSFDTYYTLGRSGLRVSRLALGTMTFGTEWGWGADEDTARQLFNTYVDAGGNFIDTADDLVRSGKVRHVGLSDTPAWYAARAQTLAEWRGYEPINSLQLEYSLVERNIEREFIPLGLELGMGITVWSPLSCCAFNLQ